MPSACAAHSGHITRFSTTPLSPSKLGSLPQQVQSSSALWLFCRRCLHPLHIVDIGYSYSYSDCLSALWRVPSQSLSTSIPGEPAQSLVPLIATKICAK